MPQIPGDKYWPEINFGEIEPPIPRKLPRRSKKKIFQEEGEGNKTNLTRNGRKMRCQFCFKLDHNSRTCPENNKQGVSNGTSVSHTINEQQVIILT